VKVAVLCVRGQAPLHAHPLSSWRRVSQAPQRVLLRPLAGASDRSVRKVGYVASTDGGGSCEGRVAVAVVGRCRHPNVTIASQQAASNMLLHIYWEAGQPKVGALGADFGSVRIAVGKRPEGWILHGFPMDFPCSGRFLDLRVGRNSLTENLRQRRLAAGWRLMLLQPKIAFWLTYIRSARHMLRETS
jgi:hypothetical protein